MKTDSIDIKIIADTGGDFTDDLVKEYDVNLIPFTIEAGDDTFLDTDDVDTEAIMRSMENSPNPVRTACPAPGKFLKAMKDSLANNIFIVTISGKLSGSFESANAAKKQFLEEFPDKKVEIIDSMSASAGEALVLYKLCKEVSKGMDFDTVTKAINEFASNMKTYFVLDSVDSLMKNGRLSRVKGTLVNVLGIKPLLGSNGEGEIVSYGGYRGSKRALKQLADRICGEAKESKNKEIFISYAGDEERARKLAESISECSEWSEIRVQHTRGLSTAYAQRGGVVVSY